jgi:hypothetical protein
MMNKFISCILILISLILCSCDKNIDLNQKNKRFNVSLDFKSNNVILYVVTDNETNKKFLVSNEHIAPL